ncbi:hypothetical protein E6W39_00255 [Kitasatospora acidiphila]|uniref:Uncharacterized protein n=1 Tax=Kitasatospora acidiphila TaxID=2567942 RepID=A0A540WGF8_9ACTN|nr:hypothetical protein E6W39_00255 [Kitasatospora acidiphila]
MPLAAWLRVGKQLGAIGNSSAWWAGDWLVYGASTYPGRYRTAISGTMLDYQTLRNYAWVARKFEVARRREALSFQHHQEVAALPPAEQDRWLDRALEHRWSKAELRRRLRGQLVPPPQPCALLRPQLRFELAAEQWTSWQQAAQCEDGDVVRWLMRLADQAVSVARGGERPPAQ